MDRSKLKLGDCQRQLAEVKSILSTVIGFKAVATFAIQELKISHDDWYHYLPSAAVNTSFCIELLLKALHRCNANVIRGHDLEKLFGNLPKGDRIAIDERLKFKRNPRSAYVGEGYIYQTVYKNQSIIIELNDFPKNISDVFEFHKKTFERFRYLFEQTSILETYYFESDVLLDLIDVLKIYVQEKLALISTALTVK